MPDVGRSDSQRSDSSQRPRVSFNRDVHVKRIGPAGGGGGGSPRIVGALAGDGAGHLVPLAVRRERPGKLSRRQLAAEARRVLQQADRVACSSTADLATAGSGDHHHHSGKDKHRNFATLPPLRFGRGSVSKNARRSLSFREPKNKKDKAPAVAAAADGVTEETPKRAGSFKRPRITLTRSASDAGKRDSHGKAHPKADASVFNSLQRPKKQRSYSDQSDRSPSPTAKPRRNILKKSHSDSETAPAHDVGDGRKKKQLSPIIEVSPREDYFVEAEEEAGVGERGGRSASATAGMLRAERAAAPASSRAGRSAVETMVKRLSADAAARPPRRPPRGVSPSALVTPGEERRHNNNLPFSYTEPPQAGAGSPTRGGSPTGAPLTSLTPLAPPQQVIYAEVVVSGGGHGQLPSKQTVHTAVPLHSDEDEGLGLSMDGFQQRRADYRSHKEYSADYEGGVAGGEFLLDRGRADGMDARRKDPLMEESSRYDAYYRSGGGGARDGYDSSSAYKTSDEYSYKMEYRHNDSGLLHSREGSPVRKDTSVFHSRVLENGDLSSRRDRLESRIESQRKDRFVTTRFGDSSYKQELHDSRSENARIGADVTYNNRREFLNSQLDSYDRDVRKENARNARRYNDIDTKKDLFADSGIEVDYRKEGTGSYKRYEDASNVKTEGMTAKIVIGSPQRGGEGGAPRVTRVDLNGRGGGGGSGGGGSDEPDAYRTTGSSHRSGGSTSFSSTRLVQEQRRTTDVLPASSVLIRHYAPKGGRGGSPSASERFIQSERTHAVERGPATDDEYETRPLHREPPEAESPRRGSPEPPRKADDKAASSKKNKDPSKKKPVSAMDRVKQLFTRSNSDSKTLKKNKKKEEKAKTKETPAAEPEEDGRYAEYKNGGGKVESDQETVTPSYRERESPVPPASSSRRRQGSPTRVVDAETLRRLEQQQRRERTPSPYGRSPSPGERYREHSPARGPPSPRRGPSPAPVPDPHLLQVPGRHSAPRQHADRALAPGPAVASARKGHRKDAAEIEFNYARQRLATPDHTPTPSPAPVRAAQSSATLNRINNQKNKEQHGGSWFKSLDRLTKRNKNRAKEEEQVDSVSQEDKSNGNNKTLRYFGDTDQEDKDSVASIPPPMPLQNHHRYKSSNHLGQSNSSTINRLHISSSSSSRNTTNRNHRPHHRSAGDVATSSAESTTEGDSSQQSQRSIVYLHAATVGDIPTPSKRSVTRRAQSREELSSVTSSHLQPQKRTISRSISVLAPWKPRHYREGQEVHYDQEDNNKNYIKNGKPPKVPVSQQSSLNSATMNRINRKKNAENKANGSHKQHVGKATSIESLSQHSSRQYGDRGTLKKHAHQAASIESLSHRSNHSVSRSHNRNKSNEKKNSMMNASTSELTATYKQNNQKKNTNDTGKKGSAKISRSASMPKDTRVKAGWFKLRNKKQGT